MRFRRVKYSYHFYAVQANFIHDKYYHHILIWNPNWFLKLFPAISENLIHVPSKRNEK